MPGLAYVLVPLNDNHLFIPNRTLLTDLNWTAWSHGLSEHGLPRLRSRLIGLFVEELEWLSTLVPGPLSLEAGPAC